MPWVEATATGLSGAVGGIVAMALIYPLEKLRLKLQVQVTRKSSPAAVAPQKNQEDEKRENNEDEVEEYKGTWHCIRQILEEEGWMGFYRGMSSALVGVGVSSLVFFYLYGLMKNLWLTQRRSIGPIANIVIAALAGVINVFITSPIWVINTRLALQKKNQTGERSYSGIWDAFKKIVAQEGILELWAGLGPSLVLVSNPVIQFVFYEQLSKSLVYLRQRRTGSPARLTPFEHFLLGAVAKAIATVVTYPYQLLKSRLQMFHAKYHSTWHAISSIYQEEGALAFYHGLSAKFLQTVLNSAFMFVAYEAVFKTILKFLRFFFPSS